MPRALAWLTAYRNSSGFSVLSVILTGLDRAFPHRRQTFDLGTGGEQLRSEQLAAGDLPAP